MSDILAVVEADEASARLWTALTPLSVLMSYWPGRWQAVIELHPLRLQIVQPRDEGRAAVVLAVMEGSSLPDGGAALQAAVDEIACAALSTMTEDGRAMVVANAAAVSDAGGLYVQADPSDGMAALRLIGPDGDLGLGTVLAVLGDAPESGH